jgi:PAS domain S-box-containing protein
MIPGRVAMNPLTALTLVMLSTALLLIGNQQNNSAKRKAGYTLCVVVLILSVIKFFDFYFDLPLKPDLLLFPSRIKEAVINGRPNLMAPNTVVCLFCGSLALLFFHTGDQKRIIPTQLLALVIGLISMLSILGYIYRVRSFYEIPFFIPMAVHTAICFFLLSVAILFAQPFKGLMKDFTSTFSGSVTAQMLIPAALIIPAALGLLRLYGNWAGLYSNEFGVAVFAVSIMVVFLGMIWYNSVLLNKRDALKLEADEALKRSREEIVYLGEVVEKSSDGIISFDEHFRIRSWNKGAEMIFGYKSTEVIGKSSREVLRSENTPGELDVLRQKIITHGYWSDELTQYNRNGQPVNSLVSTTALKDDSGKTSGYITVIKDITERKQKEIKLRQSEDELRKANSDMEAFTYSVSHDLRAPLRSIVGFTSILEDEYTNRLDDEAKRLMAVIKRNTLRMGTLIDDLLAFSKISKQDVVKTNVNTNEMVAEIIAESETNVGVEWQIAELPVMYADKHSIRQVWINLVSNAIKYSAKKGSPKIRINGVEENGSVVFSVSDNGVGFDQKYSNRLFKVFQRLHGVSEFEGTGVGLAIVERIISKHGGKVWVEAGVDKGATFYFSLPAINYSY